ncbi:hypothetical protein [Phenylobacterium conjunctum]|uniref:Heparinase II/III-like protein n=1 Tax=Phenylobacterium conjunctum TaxID=1298959 RepID=A0ABW3T449_9CAUL
MTRWRRGAMLAGLLILAAATAAAAVVTVQDLRANRAVEVSRSTVANATDTGETALLQRLAAGGQADTADLAPSLAFIDAHNDCSDFRLATLLRARLAYGSAFSQEAQARLKRTLVAFPYWMDVKGSGGPMVYWSENHQILFAQAEFLAGGLYPAALFADGRTGADHRAQARDRITFWLDQRWRFGFSEWNSHYYLEDIAALANLADFAQAPEVSRKAEIILDLLMLDLAGRSLHGEFIATSGRLYENNAKTGDEAVRRVLRHAFVQRQAPGSAHGLEINLFLSRYAAPPVLAAIAADPGAAVIRTSTGRDPGELAADRALADPERRIMAQWGMEAFTNPEGVSQSMRYIRGHGLLANPFLSGFRQLNYRALSPALPWLSRTLDLPTNGTVLGRADVYAWRTSNLVMSTTQAHRPGGFGNQQRVFIATFGPGLTVFHSHPAVRPGEPPPNGNSPGYWTGSGRLPLSCQDGPVNLSLYRLPKTPGFGRKTHLEFTHLYAPRARFDQVILEPTQLFLRKGEAWLAVSATAPLEPAGPDEIIQRGRETAWVTEASSARAETFSAFVARVRANPPRLDKGVLAYRAGGHPLTAAMAKGCARDGRPLDTAYPRHASPYAQVPRDSEAIDIAFAGHALRLDFQAGTREMH